LLRARLARLEEVLEESIEERIAGERPERIRLARALLGGDVDHRRPGALDHAHGRGAAQERVALGVERGRRGQQRDRESGLQEPPHFSGGPTCEAAFGASGCSPGGAGARGTISRNLVSSPRRAWTRNRRFTSTFAIALRNASRLATSADSIRT